MGDLINKLPNELLERIFLEIPHSPFSDLNKLELVCKKWNSINSSINLKKIRIQCLCLGPILKYAMIKCKAINHFCICLLGCHCVSSCNANIHPCVCFYDYRYTSNCRSTDFHKCICLNTKIKKKIPYCRFFRK